MCMKKEEKIKEIGTTFSAYLDMSDMTPASLARAIGSSPQTVNHWRTRGVPANKAYVVAPLIGCQPEQISDIVGKERDSQAELREMKKQLEMKFKKLVMACDDPRLLDLWAEQISVFEKTLP